MKPKSKATLAHRVSVHGHRGSRGTHPENTIPAFEEAVKAGADVLELDLQLTADDIPVVSHEPDITGALCRDHHGKPVEKPIPIRTLKAQELAQFDCGSIPQKRFPEQKLVEDTHIPTLDSLLRWAAAAAPDIEFNIETKMTASSVKLVAPPKRFAEAVIETLRRHRVVERTILQSFDFRTLEAAKHLEPRLRLSCLFETEKNFCELTARVGAQFASPYFELVSAEEVQRCHAKKIQVVPWTPNEEGQWNRLIAAGVDAIITDYPRRLISYLDEGQRAKN